MNDPIAIVGIACRFPGADTPDEYWRLLERNERGIDYVPGSRWNWEEHYSADPAVTGTMCFNQGGFIRDLDRFDWEFFGLSEFEASRLDPQQRLALEVAWEALESASIVPQTLSGSFTAAIMGVGHAEHALKLKNDYPTFDGELGPHSYDCFVSNRISYWLNLKGPSFVVNSACSSSLFAIHLACQSLRAGETDLALSGGVNVHLLPAESISSTMAGWLAADGRCKSFREHGDGFVRGEGCGMVVLKRLADAQRDGDHVWGVIRGSAIAHNGLSNGISVPNGLAQQELIRRGLRNARVEPREIGYLEAHGTGSSRGDSNEALAFMEALSPGRAPGEQCLVGCCKPNVGHLEAASGVAGLIKILLCLRHEKLPAIKHLDQLNRWIPADRPFTFLTQEHAWPARAGEPRIAGLSNFAFGGANAFFVVEEAPARPPAATAADEPKFVCFRARTAASLRAMVDRFATSPAPFTDDVLYNAVAHRSEFRERLAFSAADLPALQACVASRAAGRAYSSDGAAELYGSRAALVLTSGILGADWTAPLERLRSWSVTSGVLARWEARRADGRIPDRYAAGAAASRFLCCFWALLFRTLGVSPATVVVGPGVEGAAYAANGVAEPAELEAWILSGDPADLPALEGRRRLPMENVRPLPARHEVAARSNARARIFVNPNAVELRVPDDARTVELEGTEWRHGVLGIVLTLFSLGADIAWSAVVAGTKQPIPTYPFDKRYSWFESSVDIVEKTPEVVERYEQHALRG